MCVCACVCVFASVKEREGVCVRACVERERHFTLKGKPGRAEEKEKRNFHFFPNHSEKKSAAEKVTTGSNFFRHLEFILKANFRLSIVYSCCVRQRDPVRLCNAGVNLRSGGRFIAKLLIRRRLGCFGLT